MKLVRKKEFGVATLNLEGEIFKVYVAAFAGSSSDIHSFCQAQIVSLKTDKVLTAVLNEYADFIDVLSLNLVAELLQYTGINDYAIDFINGKQPYYGPIYSLKPVELKTLRIHIKTHLANGFIKPSQSTIRTPIFIVSKSDASLHLCVNYQGLNNLIIKN